MKFPVLWLYLERATSLLVINDYYVPPSINKVYTSKAVSYVLNEEGILVDVYIDDFYGAETQDLADLSFNRMTQSFSELGLQSSPDKHTLPTHEMTCLGICVNTLNMALTVSDFRLEDLQDLLSLWLKTHFSKRELEKLLGKVAFVTPCVRPGRAFSCRLINTLRSCFAHARHQQHPVTDALPGTSFGGNISFNTTKVLQ